MSTPYNEALGATLIDRTKRERIVLVGVTLPGHTDDDTEASLDELAQLIDTAGADEAGRLGCREAGDGEGERHARELQRKEDKTASISTNVTPLYTCSRAAPRTGDADLHHHAPPLDPRALLPHAGVACAGGMTLLSVI